MSSWTVIWGRPSSGPVCGSAEVGRVDIQVGDMVFRALAAGPSTGELVIMLHGFPQTSQSYRHQIPALAAAGFRVVAPDQRGYSPGARPADVEAYTIDHLVDDVVGMVDALGRDRFHVVGHDWGAAVAWFVAGQLPERVISLTALSVPHPFAFAEALRDPSGEQAKMSGYMDRLRADGSELRLLADGAALLRGIYGGAGLSSSEIQAYVDVLGTPEALGAALNWYRAMRVPSGTRTFTPIATPTMFVWSTGDVFLGRAGAEATGKYVHGPYRFEVLEGISHWIPEEAAERLSELLLDHLADSPGGRSGHSP